MLTISNIRKEKHGDWTRLVVDIDFGDVKTDYTEKTLWFAVKNEYADMLTDETYDAFVLVPLYLAMYYHTDLHIAGPMSKLLYQNIKWYVRRILCDFSKDLTMVDVKADGFAVVPGKGSVIGTGISCGVDSLSTIMDHFVKETDPEYRINGLFLFECGTHGAYEDPASHKLFEARYELNKTAADELGLPVVQVISNAQAFFFREIGEQKVVYLALYSCMYSLQKVIDKYYTASSDSYQEEKVYGPLKRDGDMSGFCESQIVPLLQTEHTRLIVDGCQYERSQKTENIADWDIAQRHLNVCVNTTDGTNCSTCHKCMRTLVPLEAMGKLEKFSGVFNLAIYRKHAEEAKRKMVAEYGVNNFSTDNVDFARAHHLPMPSRASAIFYEKILGGAFLFAKHTLRVVMGDERYGKLKRKIRG